MIKFLFIFIITISICQTTIAQVATPLSVGDKAPSLVLPSFKNTEESYSFPYNNKIMLLHFWSSSVSSSEQNLFKYSKLYSKYGNSDFNTANGFEVLTVALQSDRITWELDLKKYNLLNVHNLIAQKGYKDYFVNFYKLSETPTTFLIDEFGKIIYINPDIRTIMAYLANRKSNYINNTSQTSITGKIVIGDAFKNLKSSTVYLLNEKKDTLQKTMTNDQGTFSFGNINTLQNLTVGIFSNDQIMEEDNAFLSTNNNDVISIFSKTSNGYSCNIIDLEMPYFKNLNGIETVIEKPKPAIIVYTEHLYKAGELELSPSIKLKLNVIISQLKTLPNSKLEIISHTSCKGDNNLNLALSSKRANLILNYFVLKGISKLRLKAIGKGETEPLNECVDNFPCTNDELEENNRTDFKITPQK